MIACKPQLQIACACIALCAAATAHAQAPHAAAATAQFDKGRNLLKDGKYAEACAAFEESQKLDPASGTLYNLAGCYVKLGKLASAWAAYRELAQRDTKQARRADSAKQAKLLEPRLPRLAIKPGSTPPGLVVTMNDQDATNLVGIDSPVDLGSYHIVAKAPQFKDYETTVDVAEGKITTVAFELTPAPHESAPPPAPVAAAPAAPAPAMPADTRPVDEGPPTASHRKTYAAVVGGTGIALVATGLVFGNLARSHWSDVKKLCGDDLVCDQSQSAQGSQLASSARTDGNTATVLVAGGAVALGVGAYLWLTAPANGTHTALRLAPGAGPTSLGLTLQGGF